MYLVDAALNAAVDAIAGLADYLSVHTAFSTTGTSEDSGGVYAREATAWNAGASGEATLNGNVDIGVNAITAKYVGYWSAVSAGTFYGMFPIGSAGIKRGYATAVDETFYVEAHGFLAGDIVVFFGDDLPTGITQGTEYTVSTGPATDSFLCDGVTLTDDGNFVVSKLVAETFGSPGTLRVNGTTSKISALGLRV